MRTVVLDARHGGASHVGFSFGNAVRYARFRGDLDPVADGQMPGDADLPSEHAVRADLGRSGHADLRGGDGVFAYGHVMADLNQVVELDAPADDRRTHCRPVDAGVGAYFDIALDADVADLRNLVIRTLVVRSEAESVGSDHRSGVDRHVVADLALLVNLDAGEQLYVIAQTDVVAHVDMRIYLAVFPEADVRADHRELAHVGFVAQRGRRIDRRERADALFPGLVRYVQFEQLCEARVGVVDADHRRRDRSRRLERTVDDHDRRFRIVDIMLVFRVGQKSERACFSFFDFCEFRDDGLRVARDLSAEVAGDQFCGKFHIVGSVDCSVRLTGSF